MALPARAIAILRHLELFPHPPFPSTPPPYIAPHFARSLSSSFVEGNAAAGGKLEQGDETKGDSREQERDCYRYWMDIQTRWNDNDVYGHVNNYIYYAYFDTIVNNYLIERGGLNIHSPTSERGLVVGSNCRYYRPLQYPDVVQAGLRVVKIGTSSVTYRIGIFSKQEKSESACAVGSFVHVFVASDTGRPAPISERLRDALKDLL